MMMDSVLLEVLRYLYAAPILTSVFLGAIVFWGSLHVVDAAFWFVGLEP